MRDFFVSALPWVCIGIMVAMFAVNHRELKKSKENGREYANYMVEGMCLGMCVGTALGGRGLIYGMLIGLAVGMHIKKT